MKLPVHDPKGPRPLEDLCAMGRVVQANLVQLKVAECRHRGIDPAQHDIQVSSPGAIVERREALIDHRTIASYSAEEVHLRLREVWGQYCLFLWLFGVQRDGHRSDLAAEMSDACDVPCNAALEGKHAALHALLWRIQYEQRKRNAAPRADSSRDRRDEDLARRIPVEALGKPVDAATDLDLLLAASEHAGMLAALRWVLDGRRRWGEEGIMDVAAAPF